jgi:hypothetical protein
VMSFRNNLPLFSEYLWAAWSYTDLGSIALVRNDEVRGMAQEGSDLLPPCDLNP